MLVSVYAVNVAVAFVVGLFAVIFVEISDVLVVASLVDVTIFVVWLSVVEVSVVMSELLKHHNIEQ